MKQFFTLFIAVFAAQFSFAQITITEADVYVPGNTFHLANDNAPDASIQVGAAGNVDWDFSALQNNDTSIFEIIDVAGTPFAANYPTANIAILSDSTFVYFKKSADKLELIGSAFTEILDSTSTDIIINFTNPETFIEFPATFGSSFNDSANFSFTTSGEFFGADSIRLKNGNTTETEIDGFGNITTPTGTFEALRMKKQTIAFDTIEIQSLGFWIPFSEAEIGDTSMNYFWFTNQIGFEYPLVTVDMEIDSSTGAEIVGAAGWISGSTVPTSKVNLISAAEVFPVPATDVLNFQLPEVFEGRVDVIDFNGQKLSSQAINSDFLKIDLAGFLSGNYVAIFTKGNGKIAGFRKFSVVK